MITIVDEYPGIRNNKKMIHATPEYTQNKTKKNARKTNYNYTHSVYTWTKNAQTIPHTLYPYI